MQRNTKVSKLHLPYTTKISLNCKIDYRIGQWGTLDGARVDDVSVDSAEQRDWKLRARMQTMSDDVHEEFVVVDSLSRTYKKNKDVH